MDGLRLRLMLAGGYLPLIALCLHGSVFLHLLLDALLQCLVGLEQLGLLLLERRHPVLRLLQLGLSVYHLILRLLSLGLGVGYLGTRLFDLLLYTLDERLRGLKLLLGGSQGVPHRVYFLPQGPRVCHLLTHHNKQDKEAQRQDPERYSDTLCHGTSPTRWSMAFKGGMLLESQTGVNRHTDLDHGVGHPSRRRPR